MVLDACSYVMSAHDKGLAATRGDADELGQEASVMNK
jgi:hypothetical protein